MVTGTRRIGQGIMVRAVSRQYESHGQRILALDHVSLEITPGSFTCLVGPSGCGKSTLCRMLAGLDHPTSGRIVNAGKPVTGPGRDQVLMFQQAALFPWLTVLENVLFGLTQQGMPKTEAREVAMNCLRLVQLARFARCRPHELSGGMCQRVALARALAVRPAVLLMDEPFGALDAQSRDILTLELQRIWQATNTTVVYVTHNISEAAMLGTSVVLFSAHPGRIRRVLSLEHLPRPRMATDPAVTEVAALIHEELREEVERVEREEFDLGWHLEAGAVSRRAVFDAGGGI